QARRDVAFAYWRVARLLLASGQTGEAISDLESSLQIVRALAQADPNNAQAQRDVTVILIGLGDVVWETEAYDHCRRYYVEALGIRQELLESQPNHPQALRDVALCYERIADADGVLGRTSASIDGFRRALEIRRKLQQIDPNDWNVRHSIAYALTRLGEEHARIAVAAGTSDEKASEHCAAALKALTECRKLWNEIYRHSGRPPNDQFERKTVERLIAELQRADFRRLEPQSSASTLPNASK
ncbi:MAG TPA: tetratricopeptide repeat protein, partial [Planctomycetaceae bacterium]|nr:tetratricopeptide repeat protein [Planctomycetaceae bacterium]